LSTFRACLIDDDAGAKALSWLLHSGEVDRIEATFNIRFMQAITLCLVGEGKTDVRWDMPKTQHTPRRGKDATVHEKSLSTRWCSVWFTSILEAKTFLATGPSRSNDPLATFLEVIRFNREERTRITMIPITGAAAWLVKKLTSYDKRHIDVETWDAFAEFLMRYRGTVHCNSRFTHALLKLVHPSHRSAGPLITFLRHSSFDGKEWQWMARMPKGYRNLITMNLLQCCYENGRMADVRWMIDFHRQWQRQQEHSPETHEQSGRWLQARKGRKANPREVAEGLPVDAQGRLMPDTLKRAGGVYSQLKVCWQIA
jgi:hypothetical protein